MLDWINKGNHILLVKMQIHNSGSGEVFREGYQHVDQRVERFM